MQPSIQTLGKILYSPSQYMIPVFQRHYRWEEPEWIKLWESLEEIRRPDKKGNHFMGFLVFVSGLAQPGQHTAFYLIDGQQRLTTLSVLLVAMRNTAREKGENEFANEIDEYYLIHPRKKGDDRFRLLPKARDYGSYLSLIKGEPVPKGRLGGALRYFETRLKQQLDEKPDSLHSLFDTIVQRLEFMCATLEAENAYNIYKGLNSTGVPLESSDLIRNFVFMHILPEAQEEFDKNQWGPLEARFTRADGALDEQLFSRFFRDFLMSGGRYISPGDTFATFEARYEATAFSADDLAQNLLTASSDYDIISGGTTDDDPAVSRALTALNALDSSTTYPLLLSLFARRREETLETDDLARAIDMLSGFVFRRFVCGESSRGYGRMFVRGLSKNEGTVLERLEAFLMERGWPADTRFRSDFAKFPLYERGYAKHTLEMLERARGHKEPATLSDTQIEHIMPQTIGDEWRADLGSEADRIHAEWLHSPGNLTLSGYNPELWNHPFGIKRNYYSDSNVVITKELAANNAWGEQQIMARGEDLAERATRIWKGPEIEVLPEQPVDEQPALLGRFEIRHRFWEGLDTYLVTTYPELPDFDPGQSWTVRMPAILKHIGIELRFGLRHDNVGIDIWFWRAASIPVWMSIRDNPGLVESLIDSEWSFEEIEGRSRARMFLDLKADSLRDESAWPALYQWFGDKLSRLYGKVVPQLQAEMHRQGIR